MTHDVARLHARHEMIEQVQIRSADRATRYLDDRVAVVLDLWIRNPFTPDIGRAVPNKRFHVIFLLDGSTFEPQPTAFVPIRVHETIFRLAWRVRESRGISIRVLGTFAKGEG